MNDEELSDYITELLSGANFKVFKFEEYTDDNTRIIKTNFKNNGGWEINKEDRWEE